MNWLTIRTRKYKHKAKECWHYWFVWHPVTVKTYPDGAKERVWLEKVKRKGRYVSHGLCDYGWEYEYKRVNE